MKKYYKNPNPYTANSDPVSAEILARSAQVDLEEARNAILGFSGDRHRLNADFKKEARRAFMKARMRINQALKNL